MNNADVISTVPSDPFLQVRDLVMHYPIHAGVMKKTVGHVKAVDGVSFTIARGKTMGLVGESGCGKSTTGFTMLRLVKATGGSVILDGEDVFAADKKRLNSLRTKMQIVFQDPYSSLNPRLPVWQIVGEAMLQHKIVASKREASERVIDIIGKCGLLPEQASRYPHQFSGGQRQRICIARALALDPEFVVCDEAVSALDVSIQSQIINLLKDLQDELGLTYLFISHDLSVVKFISDDIGVMYLGQMVEYGSTDHIFADPLHPYTKGLLSAALTIDTKVWGSKRKRAVIEGDIPSPANPPSGCRFHTRCPIADEQCRQVMPERREATPGHFVMCHKA